MPYIPKPDRTLYDAHIDALVDALITNFSQNPTTIPTNRAGHLNYILSSLVSRFYRGLTAKLSVNSSLRYGDYNEIIGFLECMKLELYRRLVANYEDKKIIENGDVF